MKYMSFDKETCPERWASLALARSQRNSVNHFYSIKIDGPQ